MTRLPFSCVEDSDGCKMRRVFFNQKNITNSRQGQLFAFTISCTTQTVYTVRYTTGELCNCGEYFVDNHTITETCHSQLSSLDFSVEISVEHSPNQWGENCSFVFFFPFDILLEMNFNVSILPELRTGTLTFVFYFRCEN